MRAAFYTLGCKVNQYETQILTQLFSANGFDIVDPDSQADVYVVNSCTVTSSGDKKTRQALRKFKRLNPCAAVCLTGCFPQAFPESAAKVLEADVITGSYNRKGLLNAVMTYLQTGERVIDITKHTRGEEFEKMQADSFLERTRACIKIQDGCDRYCTYCIIPTARGPIRSKPLDEIKSELLTLAQAGYKEVVMVGINLSSYGKEIGLRLVDAVVAAENTPGISRIRLGSLEPELLTDEDIKTLASLKKFCPQFHLSLQSGCDETLKRMNRHYTTAEYYEIVEKLRSAFKDVSITTDIMVGFAGETEEEFNKSVEFAKKVGFAKAHVFAYSKREGTRAATMPNQVAKALKEQRSKLMIKATEESRIDFLNAQINKTEEVLFETTMQDGYYEGYTKNYTPVLVKSDVDLRGLIKDIKITSVLNDSCIGELIS